jgi:hypothetical protein
MAFFYEKELRAYCAELRRDHKRLSREFENSPAYGEITNAEDKILAKIARVEKQMVRLEKIVRFPGQPA